MTICNLSYEDVNLVSCKKLCSNILYIITTMKYVQTKNLCKTYFCLICCIIGCYFCVIIILNLPMKLAIEIYCRYHIVTYRSVIMKWILFVTHPGSFLSISNKDSNSHIVFLNIAEITCGNPGTVLSNGIVTGSEYTYGKTVTYSCNAHYNLTGGSVSRTCQSNQVWSGTQPRCACEADVALCIIKL